MIERERELKLRVRKRQREKSSVQALKQGNKHKFTLDVEYTKTLSKLNT